MANGSNLPIDKPRRVRDAKAIDRARRPWCEYCGHRGGRHEVHHVKSRGAGGGDGPSNLVNLCAGPGTNDCHGRVHAGLIPRDALREIIRRREADHPHAPPPA